MKSVKDTKLIAQIVSESGCVLPSLGSNPDTSQPEMEKLDLNNLATDPPHVSVRKGAGTAINRRLEPCH